MTIEAMTAAGPPHVAGVLSRIEIWDRDQWAAERSAAEEQSAELAEHLSALGL